MTKAIEWLERILAGAENEAERLRRQEEELTKTQLERSEALLAGAATQDELARDLREAIAQLKGGGK